MSLINRSSVVCSHSGVSTVQQEISVFFALLGKEHALRVDNNKNGTRPMMASAASVQRRLAADFPCLVAESLARRAYTGFIRVRGHDFRLRLAADCSRLDGDAALCELLAPGDAAARLRASADAHAFLLELRDLLERALSAGRAAPALTELPAAAFYDRLLAEIALVGWENVEHMDESMRNVSLAVVDDAARRHTVQIALPVEYPAVAPVVTTALPVRFELQWVHHASLQAIITQFSAAVAQFQDLFRALDDMDEHTWILEPEHPTRSDVYRRIALGRHCSVRIELDPRAPITGFPECRFLGSEAAIGPLKQRLNQYIHLWDTSGAVLPRVNLERVLDLTLPSPARDGNAGNDEDGIAVECGICYAYRLEDRVPDVACDRAACAKPYHRPCLIEWLRALPDTRQSFDTLFGACVYCEHPITVSMTAE